MSGEPENQGVEDLGDVLFDATKIATIEERSDVDPHENLDKGKLGEDWGDGFFVSDELVLVERDNRGVIRRTTPLSEVPFLEQRDEPLTKEDIVEGKPQAKPAELSRAEKAKLVDILAYRLVKEYKSRLATGGGQWNPYRDGIPKSMMSGKIPTIPGTDMVPATDGQVFEFFKKIVADRVTVIEKNKGYGDYRDLSLRFER